ncbi:MAG: IPT/TIG domain-containing protein [Dysgonamonadaceae bacterium]|nr:IPT/TIG domain-containing protein [Dysgonamonadaceae bacterium]MDD3900377.1 IPT/TIG domain-containing protein [Dysgonamonadaceae bacterium]MEA5081668.1 IPT/TIG domain-containing protein [Dysgonamonadaceae bacterium]
MTNKRLINLSSGWLLPTIFLVFFSFLFSCGENDAKPDKSTNYDPSKPIMLNTFYPDSGEYLEQVLLTGSNFGTDPEQIRVYFNQKKAAVVGTTGERMYVLAPRLPGDTCVISVAIGDDSVSYEKPFMYHKSVSVSTIAGNGNLVDYQDGDLTNSILQPIYLCVDKEDNLFVITRSRYNNTSSQMHVARIDEEGNQLITIARDLIGNAPAADPVTGVITFPTETTVGSFVSLDPKEMWAPRYREMKWPAEGDTPDQGYKHSMVVNPSDGYIYTRYYHGHIIKIHPRTYEVETIYKSPQGDSYGLTFVPDKPNILYISFWDNSGVNANSICSIDVSDPENSFTKLTGSTSGGHRDGKLSTAQFKNPAQIYSDADGNIYVADSGNHCIRRITPEGMVETVLGMPGTAGWKDGGKEEALFNTPRGLGISSDGSIYVADNMNGRIRKLSIN